MIRLWKRLLALSVALFGLTAAADTHTWTGLGANNNWTNAANWGGTAPVAGDSLTFDGTTRRVNTNNFTANTTFSNITFNGGAGAFTLKGNAFILAGEIVNSSASLQTFGLGFSSSSTCSINTAAGDVTVSGVIAGACVLYKRGDAKLTLSGNNTYSVGTTIGGGTLSISKDNTSTHHLGALSAGCTLKFDGGALEVTGGALYASGQNWLLRNIILGPGGGTVVSPLEIGHEDYSGIGEFVTGGTAANGLTLKGGDIVVRPGAQNTLGKLTAFSGRTFLRNDVGNRYPVGVADEILVKTGAFLIFSDHMPRSLTNSFTFEIDSVLCTRTHTDYSGAMTLSTTRANFPSSGRMFFNYDDQATDSITINGAWPTLTGDLTIQVGTIHATVGTVTLNCAISGEHAFTKTESGTLVLAGTNSHTGGTTVSAGLLEARRDGALGSGNATVADGATLKLSSGASHNYIRDSAGLLLNGTATVDLAYTGTDVVAALSFDGGATFQAFGTWGSSSSTAANKSSRFAGTGILLVAAPTTTELASSTNPSIYGQAVTFTAAVTAANPEAGTPTGAIQFKTNGANFGSAVSLSSGSATSSALPITCPAGTHAIAAVYLPNVAFGASTGTLADGQTVLARPVHLTGTRVYDGTTDAAAGILTAANKVDGDDVSVAFGTGTLASASAGAQTIVSFDSLALGGAAAANYTLVGASGTVTITAGAVTQTRVETAADGSGIVFAGQSVRTGSSVTVYAITRDAGGNFVSNAVASWSLIDITGGVTAGDLVANPDGRSAVFTGHATGTARIQAGADGFTGQSGTFAVPLESGTIQLPRFEEAAIGTAQPTYPAQTYWVNGTSRDQYAQWSIGAGGGVGGSDAAIALPGTNAMGGNGVDLRVYYFPVVSNTPYTISLFYKAIGPGFSGMTDSNASRMELLVLESPNLEGGSWLPWYGTNIGIAAAEWTNALYTFTSQPATRCVCLKFGIFFGYGNRADPTDSFHLDDDRGTTQTLAASVNPSVFGQPVTFTATVSPVIAAAGTPTGTVQFKTNGADFGAAVPLSGAIATSDPLPASLLPGTYTITADYDGDAQFTRSTTALPDGQTVIKADSTTTPGASRNPSMLGESVTFTARVTAIAPGAGIPTGTIQFKADASGWGAAAALSDGDASSVARTDLAAGTHTITVEYSGDAGFNANTGTLAGGQVVENPPMLDINPASLLGSNVVEWAGTSSWHYTIQYATSLYPSASWSNLPGCVEAGGSNGTMSVADTNANAERIYYRVRLTRPP